MLLNVAAAEVKDSKMFFPTNIDCRCVSANGESSCGENMSKSLGVSANTDFTAFYHDILRRTSRSPTHTLNKQTLPEPDVSEYPEEILLGEGSKVLESSFDVSDEDDSSDENSGNGDTAASSKPPRRKEASTNLFQFLSDCQ